MWWSFNFLRWTVFDVRSICALSNGLATCGEVSISSIERFSMFLLNKMQTRTFIRDRFLDRAFRFAHAALKQTGPVRISSLWRASTKEAKSTVSASMACFWKEKEKCHHIAFCVTLYEHMPEGDVFKHDSRIYAMWYKRTHKSDLFCDTCREYILLRLWKWTWGRSIQQIKWFPRYFTSKCA